MTYFQDAQCYSTNPAVSVWTAVVMYGSYFILFLKFYFDRWMDNKRRGREAKEKDAKSKTQ